MSELDRLLESANPYKSLQTEAARLANKWEKTGLLKDLDEIQKNNMALILENQAKQLIVEASTTGGGANAGTFTVGTGAQWAGIALPMVRKVFGQISSKEYVSVQPMNLPSGLVFYLDFQYGSTKSPFTSGDSMFGNIGDNAPFGNTDEGGLYGAGKFGFSINNTSSVIASASVTVSTPPNFYTELQADSSFVDSGSYYKISIPTSSIHSNFDTKAVRGFYFSGTNDPTVAQQFPGFTHLDSSGNLVFITNATGSMGSGGSTNTTLTYTLQPTDRNRGDFEDGNTNLNTSNDPISIPEIKVDMKSEAIVAKTRKLKAVWTPEFAQDLNAYQSLDAEAELTSVMSEYISLEIDLEIIDMLIQGASAGTEYWSAQNNLSIGSSGVVNSDLGFYNTQGAWFQTLGTKIQKLSNIIHQKTLRGAANFMIVSPTVGTILEAIPGFASTSDGDASKANYAFGIQKAGQLNSRYQVWKNPYMKENTILLGFRGSQFLEAGAVFAPYIPLIMTPLVYDPDTFTPRKGLLTRYAKKMLRPEFYGKIYVGGLNTL